MQVQMNDLPASFRHRNRARNLINDGDWTAHAPALQQIQQWIELHWNAERPTQHPPGTVLTDTRTAPQCGPRLDDATATRKLVVAAALYGPETVAGYAVDFARHGLVEIRSIYLLKGPSIGKPTCLDAYCSLLPYREALSRIRSSFPSGTFRSPPDNVDGVCALQCKFFGNPINDPIDENNCFASPLLHNEVEALALVTGLVWGTGLRIVEAFHATPVAVEAVLPFWLPGIGYQ